MIMLVQRGLSFLKIITNYLYGLVDMAWSWDNEPQRRLS